MSDPSPLSPVAPGVRTTKTLRDYVQHLPTCGRGRWNARMIDFGKWEPGACTCGLDALLALPDGRDQPQLWPCVNNHKAKTSGCVACELLSRHSSFQALSEANEVAPSFFDRPSKLERNDDPDGGECVTIRYEAGGVVLIHTNKPLLWIEPERH